MRHRFTFILLLIVASLHGQGWQRYYSGGRLFQVNVQPDGSLVAAGGTDSSAYWLHTDAWGNLLSQQAFSTSAMPQNIQFLLPDAGGWTAWGNVGAQQVQGWTLDSDGQYQQTLPYIGSATLYGGSEMNNGAQVLCGASHHRAWAALTDASGQLVWASTDSVGPVTTYAAAVPLGNAGAFLLGYYVNPGLDAGWDCFVERIAPNGGSLLRKVYDWPGQYQVQTGLARPDGHVWAIGATEQPNDPAVLAQDLFIAQIDTLGTVVWRKSIPLEGYQIPHACTLLPNGTAVIVGETRPTPNGSRDAFGLWVDPSGNLIRYKTYGGLKGDIFWDVDQLSNGELVMAGQSLSFGNGQLHAWLLRTDAVGNLWSHTLQGHVGHDTQQNCLLDPNEPPLGQWLVKAEGAPGAFYTLTDNQGAYQMALDTGVWYVSVQPLVSAWVPCLDSVWVHATAALDSTTVDFAIQSSLQCPALEVNIAAPYLRRCFENTYTVGYQNYGTAPADDAYVAVVLDPYLTFTGSNWPFTVQGDSLLFLLDTVPVGAQGSFQFTAYLDCDSTVLGQMHCTSAHIFPDTLCGSLSAQWTGAHLEVMGYCAGDSVVLTITNTGIGGMQGPVEYVIIEDQIIFKLATLQLAAGESITEVVYPNGATVTLLVPQPPGHPAGSTPVLVVESCGNSVASTGYAYQFPTDDGQLSHDTDCRANIGSFDPNDKSALPIGVGDDHAVEAGAALEYLIRFQNTGTDTAFRVEIRDTLDPALQVATLEMCAASHPFRWEVVGQGVLRFVFDPIALPDSNTHWAASQGFVRFRINTKPNLPEGAAFTNRAAIYFDFNAPVLTNIVQHTIGEAKTHLLTPTQEAPDVGTPMLLAAPHPIVAFTHLQWTGGNPSRPYCIRLVGLNGQVLSQYTSATTNYYLSASACPNQPFVIEISQDGHTIASGLFTKSNH